MDHLNCGLLVRGNLHIVKAATNTFVSLANVNTTFIVQKQMMKEMSDKVRGEQNDVKKRPRRNRDKAEGATVGLGIQGIRSIPIYYGIYPQDTQHTSVSLSQPNTPTKTLAPTRQIAVLVHTVPHRDHMDHLNCGLLVRGNLTYCHKL
jgi:hypothetical protein